MSRTKSLTKRIQAQRTPLIIERDYPDGEEHVCFFCEQRFIKDHKLGKRSWEHLDNNDKNEELWNLVWAHHYCNEKKRYDADLQILAHEKIKQNKRWEETYDFESVRARKIKSPTEEQTEIDLNVAHMQITREFLAEKLPNYDSKHALKDAIFCMSARCRKQTGHGSPQSVRNYIDELCCSEGPYKIEKQNGKNYIFRRTGQ